VELGGQRPAENARELAHLLAHGRDALIKVEQDQDRRRHAEALDHMAQYVALLREAPDQKNRFKRYAFKLELSDGRWGVEEKELAAPPSVGEVVEFADEGRWKVLASQMLKPRPVTKPARELFVCSPA
jgi:hypothetical protein